MTIVVVIGGHCRYVYPMVGFANGFTAGVVAKVDWRRAGIINPLLPAPGGALSTPGKASGALVGGGLV